MKKILFFLVIFLLVFTCTSCGTAEQNEIKPSVSDKDVTAKSDLVVSPYLADPLIFLTANHKYGDSNTFQVKDGSMKVAAYGFSLDISFEKDIKSGDIQNLITMSGCSMGQNMEYKNGIVYLYCPQGVPGKTYTLNI